MTEQAPAADNDDEESDEGSLAELLCLPDVPAWCPPQRVHRVIPA